MRRREPERDRKILSDSDGDHWQDEMRPISYSIYITVFGRIKNGLFFTERAFH